MNFFYLARPTSEVLDWLEELFDIIVNEDVNDKIKRIIKNMNDDLSNNTT